MTFTDEDKTGRSAEIDMSEMHRTGPWDDEPDPDAEARAALADADGAEGPTSPARRPLTEAEQQAELDAIREQEVAREAVPDGETVPDETYDAGSPLDVDENGIPLCPRDGSETRTQSETPTGKAPPRPSEKIQENRSPRFTEEDLREADQILMRRRLRRDAASGELAFPGRNDQAVRDGELLSADSLPYAEEPRAIERAHRKKGALDRRSLDIDWLDRTPYSKSNKQRQRRLEIGFQMKEVDEIVEGYRDMPATGDFMPDKSFLEITLCRAFLPHRSTYSKDFPFDHEDENKSLPEPIVHKVGTEGGRVYAIQLDPLWVPFEDSRGRVRNTWFGFPHAKWGRLALYTLYSEAARTGTPEVDLCGGSARELIKKHLGFNPSGTDITSLVDAMRCWAGTSITLIKHGGQRLKFGRIPLFQGPVSIRTKIDTNGNIETILPETITLNSQVIDRLNFAATPPIHDQALKALSGGRQMDVFLWLTTYLPFVNRDNAGCPAFVSWKNLRDRFYSDRYRPWEVKAHFPRVLSELCEVWPRLQRHVRVCNDGIELHRIPPMIPTTKMAEAAQERQRKLWESKVSALR